jgi:predicted RNase H-like HicB family nuclease
MSGYIAIVHKDADSDYGVSFPDFASLTATAPSMAAARTKATELLSLHLE